MTLAESPQSTQHVAEIERLHAISVEIASLQELSGVMDRALDYCLELTQSAFGFVGLMQGTDQMDVAAVKGFVPSDSTFHERFRTIPVRPSVFGIVVLTGQPHLSNNVAEDALHVGTPRGHPPVRTFLGVPLLFGSEVLGMLGVANCAGGYNQQQQRLLAVFANQVAVAIRNARLYEEQRNMIARLQQLRGQVEAAERERLLDDERRRIAQELHDRVAQTLFSIGLTAQAAMDSNGAAAHKGMAKSTNGAPGANGAGTATDNNATAAESPERAALQSIRSLSAVGNEQMREAIFALTHGELPERGLARNLWHTVRDFRERTGLDADLVLAGKEPRLSQEAAEALLAAAREALANVEQHAHATSAVVSLRTTNSAATLVVQDDGVGPRPLVLRSIGSSTRHFGLRGVRDRVRALGGSFTVRRGEDGGFVLRVRVAT